MSISAGAAVLVGQMIESIDSRLSTKAVALAGARKKGTVSAPVTLVATRLAFPRGISGAAAAAAGMAVSSLEKWVPVAVPQPASA